MIERKLIEWGFISAVETKRGTLSPVHHSESHGVHADLFTSDGGKEHIPYRGQTSLDMFSGRRSLGEQAGRLNQFSLGSLENKSTETPLPYFPTFSAEDESALKKKITGQVLREKSLSRRKGLSVSEAVDVLREVRERMVEEKLSKFRQERDKKPVSWQESDTQPPQTPSPYTPLGQLLADIKIPQEKKEDRLGEFWDMIAKHHRPLFSLGQSRTRTTGAQDGSYDLTAFAQSYLAEFEQKKRSEAGVAEVVEQSSKQLLDSVPQAFSIPQETRALTPRRNPFTAGMHETRLVKQSSGTIYEDPIPHRPYRPGYVSAASGYYPIHSPEPFTHYSMPGGLPSYDPDVIAYQRAAAALQAQHGYLVHY